MGKSISRHGLSVGMERVGREFFLTFKAIGTLTHKDYETITPLIDSALKGVEQPKIKAFLDISEFEGWELRAAWDDFRLGLKYGSDFEKIAIYGHQKWIEYGAKISSWFISGEIKQFDNIDEALTWLQV